MEWYESWQQAKTVQNEKKGEMDVPGLRVVELDKYRFTVTPDYQIWRLLKTSSGYDKDVAWELHKMAKKIAVQLKERTFSGNELISLIAIL